MFDPARDEDPGNQSFWSRILRTGLVALGLGLVTLPAVMGFHVATGNGATKDCVAIVHAWQPGPPPAGQARFIAAGTRAACVPESRHRLVLSSVGGVAVLGTALLVTVVTRRRRSVIAFEPEPRFEYTAPASVDVAPSIAAAFRGASTLPAQSKTLPAQSKTLPAQSKTRPAHARERETAAP